MSNPCGRLRALFRPQAVRFSDVLPTELTRRWVFILPVFPTDEKSLEKPRLTTRLVSWNNVITRPCRHRGFVNSSTSV